jgi:hypothetical protein
MRKAGLMQDLTQTYKGKEISSLPDFEKVSGFGDGEIYRKENLRAYVENGKVKYMFMEE